MKRSLMIALVCCRLHAHEPLSWDQEKIQTAHITLEKASSGEIHNILSVPGKIIFHPDRIAYVFPKVSGVASSICKNLGDRVQVGDILAVLESREIAEAKALYLGALKKLDLTCTLLMREENLKGISPEQDYLNSKLESEEANLQVDLAKQTLYSMGLTQEDVNKIETENPIDLRYYSIKAPIYGKILQRNLTLGELVTSSTKVFTIASFDQVWVEISVNQNDVAYLQENLQLEIRSSDGKCEDATLYQFNPAIQEETRRATAIAVLNNPENFWKTGEYVTVNIRAETIKASIVIPKTAIQIIHDEHVVFVQQGDHFVERIVTIGQMDETHAEILSGLKEGEIYAATNTFVIKSELEKEGAEHES